MSHQNVGTEVQIFNVVKERLILEFSLGGGEGVLWDTLDGQCSLKEIIVEMAREAKEAEAFAAAVATIMADNKTRKERYERKAERLRDLAAWAMQETGRKNITAADLTISQREGKPSVIPITSEPGINSALRFTRLKTTAFWDKPALLSALQEGDTEALACASLSNPRPILTITTK